MMLARARTAAGSAAHGDSGRGSRGTSGEAPEEVDLLRDGRRDPANLLLGVGSTNAESDRGKRSFFVAMNGQQHVAWFDFRR